MRPIGSDSKAADRGAKDNSQARGALQKRIGSGELRFGDECRYRCRQGRTKDRRGHRMEKHQYIQHRYRKGFHGDETGDHPDQQGSENIARNQQNFFREPVDVHTDEGAEDDRRNGLQQPDDGRLER